MRLLFIMFHPRFTTARPMLVIMDRHRYTGVTIAGYVIIVIAAVAIDPTMHAMACPINLPHPFRQRGNRHGEMVQCREGLRLHRSGWWRKGHIRGIM
jgi:hypothetical protein